MTSYRLALNAAHTKGPDREAATLTNSVTRKNAGCGTNKRAVAGLSDEQNPPTGKTGAGYSLPCKKTALSKTIQKVVTFLKSKGG